MKQDFEINVKVETYRVNLFILLFIDSILLKMGFNTPKFFSKIPILKVIIDGEKTKYYYEK